MNRPVFGRGGDRHPDHGGGTMGEQLELALTAPVREKQSSPWRQRQAIVQGGSWTLTRNGNLDGTCIVLIEEQVVRQSSRSGVEAPASFTLGPMLPEAMLTEIQKSLRLYFADDAFSEKQLRGLLEIESAEAA